MLFGRGHWAIFGIEPSSLEPFRTTLEDQTKMLMLSQLSAITVAKYTNKPATGINPFEAPRLDEQGVDTDFATLAEALKDDPPTFSEEMLDRLSPIFGSGERAFKLHDTLPVYGFWFVHNEGKDVTDAASKREQASYVAASRPFKFLNKDEKKSVELSVVSGSVTARKQFPVLVDFEQGRVYAATTSQDQVYILRGVLQNLGAEVHSLRWDFDGSDWPERFLAQIVATSKYQDEFARRADELTRFKVSEVEPEEDKQVEKIVSTYFSMSELDTSAWVGLAPDAGVRLHQGGETVGVSSPGEVNNLLSKFDKANVASCTAVFQERVSKFRKGVEVTFFKNNFQIDIGDKTAMPDVGAVVLRGFDVCGFKRAMVKELKKTKTELSIAHYWFEYLRQMRNSVYEYIDNLTETLVLDKKQYGLIGAPDPDDESVEEAE